VSYRVTRYAGLLHGHGTSVVHGGIVLLCLYVFQSTFYISNVIIVYSRINLESLTNAVFHCYHGGSRAVDQRSSEWLKIAYRFQSFNDDAFHGDCSVVICIVLW
jgi:hypothetical protein